VSYSQSASNWEFPIVSSCVILRVIATGDADIDCVIDCEAEADAVEERDCTLWV